MIEYFNNISPVVTVFTTIISAVVSILSIIFIVKQLHLSNKQSLFKKRLGNYLEIENLIKTYEIHSDIINKLSEDEPIMNCDRLFFEITLNLKFDISDDDRKKIKFGSSDLKILSEISKLEILKTEANLIYKKDVNNDIDDFLISFKTFLENLLYYQRVFEYTKRKDNDLNYNFDFSDYNFKEALENVDEHKERLNVVHAVKKMRESYSVIMSKDVMKKLRKQIKL